MIRARVNVFGQGFTRVTEQLERRVVEGLDAAAAEAAEVAQAGASINLELEIVPAHGTPDGYAAGIKSRRKTKTKGKTTPIAGFFDQGTLGERKKPLKRARKESWTVEGGVVPHTGHRRDVAGKGIKPQKFFGKAHRAGRRKLLERIHEPF